MEEIAQENVKNQSADQSQNTDAQRESSDISIRLDHRRREKDRFS